MICTFSRAGRVAAVFCFMLSFSTAVLAQSSSYQELKPQVIEERLRKYPGSVTDRGNTIKKLFLDSGCTQVKEHPVSDSKAPNVSCTLPGTGNDVIIVGAHFDYVSAGDGVADNWSGASLLPSLFQSLRSSPRSHTFIFVGFTDEEEGLVGSKSYVDKMSKEEISRTKAMITLDTLGLGTTEVWVNDSDRTLVSLLASVASTLKLPVTGMNVDNIGDSDGRSFKRKKIPVITLHSVTADNLRILHTNKDNMSAIKLDDYYDSYILITNFLVALDFVREIGQPAGREPHSN